MSALHPIWQIKLALPIEQAKLAPSGDVIYLALLDYEDARPSDPQLCAISLDGKLLWEKACQTGGNPLDAELCYGSSGEIYVVSREFVRTPSTHLSSRIVAFSQAGERLWLFDADAPLPTAKAGSGPSGQADLIVSGQDGLIALDRTGQVTWIKQPKDDQLGYGALINTAIANSGVFVASLASIDPNLQKKRCFLQGLNADGSIRWESDISGIFLWFLYARHDGSIVTAIPMDDEGEDMGSPDWLASFSATGKLEWYKPSAGYDVTAAPTRSGYEYISNGLYTSNGADLVAIAKDGSELWRCSDLGKIISALELDDSLLCISYSQHEVYPYTRVSFIDRSVDFIKVSLSGQTADVRFSLLDHQGRVTRALTNINPTLYYRTAIINTGQELVMLGDDATRPWGSKIVVAFKLPLAEDR